MKRLDYAELSPDMYRSTMQMGLIVGKSSLTPTERDLINIRASQLNGCAFCLDMHVKEAKIHGERELRLYHVPIWRESELFTDKERALLEFTEVLTLSPAHGLNDEVYARVRVQLSEKEISDATFAVGLINLWNRLNAVGRTPPGSFDKMMHLDRAGLN